MSDSKEPAKRIFYLLASGGYLKEVRLDVLEFPEEDEAFDSDEWENFEEYIDYQINEARAEYEQGLSQTFVISEKDLPYFVGILSAELNKLNG